MKLKREFITQQIGDRQYMVATDSTFRGMISSNKTAAFIVDCLKEETTEEAIVDKMYAKYDASREKISSDVKKFIGILRSVGALEE
ncbi:MAG: PqqD family protein [Lachnospiraceae bacterium]|nr:PqqD family protein [Lachnospiraceae bacterium]